MAEQKTIEQLQEELAAALKDKVALEAEVESSAKTIAELSKEKDEAVAKAGGGVPITIDKKKYLITIPQFEYEGMVIKASELVGDSKLAAQLLKEGFGGLKPVIE